MRFKESLENIEKDSNKNVKFTFFDPQNNIAIQNEILDSVLIQVNKIIHNNNKVFHGMLLKN